MVGNRQLHPEGQYSSTLPSNSMPPDEKETFKLKEDTEADPDDILSQGHLLRTESQERAW